jgi:hypothetical protein
MTTPVKLERCPVTDALQPFADFADFLDSETTGFSETDELDLSINDHLLIRFKVEHFLNARIAMHQASPIAEGIVSEEAVGQAIESALLRNVVSLSVACQEGRGADAAKVVAKRIHAAIAALHTLSVGGIEK